jgi:hypothetical protein
MATVNQEFQSAPAGRRVVAQMFFGFGAMLVAFVFAVGIAYHRQRGHPLFSTEWILSLFFPFLGILLALPAFLRERARIAQFRIEENVLVLGKERFPLEGLVEVARDPQVLRRARRAFAGQAVIRRLRAPGTSNGQGKFCSIIGTFKSERLGKFYAFLSGTENAVVLRWPDKAVAVSPADAEFFIYMARSAAGLR